MLIRLAFTAVLALSVISAGNCYASGGDADPEMRVQKKAPAKVSPPPVYVPPPPRVKSPPAVRSKPKPVVRKAPPKPQRSKQAQPASKPVWEASYLPNGNVVVTNGDGISFTYFDRGQPLLIIMPTVTITAANMNSATPVSFVVDGVPFMTLQAQVHAAGLVIEGIDLLRLQQKLRPSRDLKLMSAFAARTTSLSGFTKAIEELDFVRNQVALQATAAQQEPQETSTKTVVKVKINTQPVEETPDEMPSPEPEAPAVESGPEETPAAKSGVEEEPASAAAAPAGDENTSNTAATPPEPEAPATTVVAEATAQPVKTNKSSVSAEAEVEVTTSNADVVNKRIGELKSEITILAKVLAEQQSEQASTVDLEARATIEQTIASITSRMDVLEREFDAKNKKFEIYLTSVRPNDKDLYLTARKASQVFPKVPYFIPGTREQGEFWIEPKVSQVGELMFNFRMIDPSSEIELTRNLIEISLPQLEEMQAALVKIARNSKIAHENKIRRNYQKRIVCFPVSDCPQERQNGQLGKASTEVIFLVYEDGSTAGRLQVNKGAFQEGVNLSIESAMLLQAYIGHVVKEAKLEYKSGTQTIGDLDKIFE